MFCWCRKYPKPTLTLLCINNDDIYIYFTRQWTSALLNFETIWRWRRRRSKNGLRRRDSRAVAVCGSPTKARLTVVSTSHIRVSITKTANGDGTEKKRPSVPTLSLTLVSLEASDTCNVGNPATSCSLRGKSSGLRLCHRHYHLKKRRHTWDWLIAARSS